MRSLFIFPEKRLRLASMLRRNGFYVRMHGYEYLVAHGNAFLCLVLLQPLENIVLIKEFKWAGGSHMLIEKVIELIRTIDAKSRVIIY